MTSWNDAGKTELPKTMGNYLKFEQGANKFRILSEPIMGWEYWTEAKSKEKSKPIRSVERPSVIPLDADISKGWNPRYFWAFVVWNLNAKRLQILEITQKGLLKGLQDLINNEDYGNPQEYSITVTRTGEGLESEYTLVPSPPKPVPADIKKIYEETPIRLSALLDGEDPFNAPEKEIETTEEDLSGTSEDLSGTSFDDSVPF